MEWKSIYMCIEYTLHHICALKSVPFRRIAIFLLIFRYDYINSKYVSEWVSETTTFQQQIHRFIRLKVKRIFDMHCNARVIIIYTDHAVSLSLSHFPESLWTIASCPHSFRLATALIWIVCFCVRWFAFLFVSNQLISIERNFSKWH